MKRSALYLFFALVFFLWSISFYVNTITIPKHLKKLIVTEAEKFLGRRVNLADLHFNPFKGFICTGITIYEEDSSDIFATIAHTEIQPLYWPLLRGHKVVLSSLKIESVQLNLIHYVADQWNLTDILERRAKSHRADQSNIFLSKIKILNGRIKITSLEDGFQFTDELTNIDVSVGLSAVKGIFFKGTLAVNDPTNTISVMGNYQLFTQKLSAAVQLGQLNLKPYFRLFNSPLPISINEILIRNADTSIEFEKNIWKVRGNLLLNKLSMQSVNQSLKTDLLSVHPYDIQFNDGNLTGQGSLRAENLEVSDHAITTQAKTLSAEIKQWESQKDKINTTASLETQQMNVTIPEKFSTSGNLKLNHLIITKTPENLSIDAAAQLSNAKIKTPTVEAIGDFAAPRFTFSQTQESSTAQGDLFASNLTYRWPQRQLTGQIAITNWQLQGNPGSFWNSQSTVQGRNLNIQISPDKSFTGDITGTSQLEFSIEKNNFQIKNDFQINQGLLQLSKRLTLTANPSGSLLITSREDPTKPINYSGQLIFKEGQFNGTTLGAINQITGIVSFKNDHLETSSLSFSAFDTSTQASGILDNFTSPQLNLNIHVDDFDVSAAQKIIPHILTKHHLSLSGKAKNLNVTYQGPLSASEDAKINFSADLQKTHIFNSTIGFNLSNLVGHLSYQDKTLSWKDMNIQYQDIPYTLTGKLIAISPPLIDTTIESDTLKLHTRFTHSQNTITFEQLSGRYKQAFLNIKGSQSITSDGHRQVDFNGDIEFDLSDLPSLITPLPELIKKSRLSGKTSIKGQFSGDLAHWQDWKFNLTGSSPELSAWGLYFKNIKFNAVQHDNLLKPLHIWGEFYDGEINIFASLDTSKKELPFELVTRILESDLKKLNQDTPLKEHSLSGTFSSTGIFNGELINFKNLNGKGGVDIKDGFLWEIDLLKGLGGILLIPEYKDVVFTQAGMNYVVDKGVLSTDNIQLVGPTLSLYGKGNIDFPNEQTLKLFLTPDFNSEVVYKSSSLKRSTTAIITQTEKFMSVEVTGTLAKPQYKVNKSPVKILQKTGGVILENVSQFFQNIF